MNQTNLDLRELNKKKLIENKKVLSKEAFSYFKKGMGCICMGSVWAYSIIPPAGGSLNYSFDASSGDFAINFADWCFGIIGIILIIYGIASNFFFIKKLKKSLRLNKKIKYLDVKINNSLNQNPSHNYKKKLSNSNTKRLNLIQNRIKKSFNLIEKLKARSGLLDNFLQKRNKINPFNSNFPTRNHSKSRILNI